MNKEYTNLWIEQFGEEEVLKYHEKFYSKFEKNIKHRQQVDFISKFLKPELKWLDAPIGSGRITKALKTNHMYGFDRSPAFIEHNRKLGITCIEGDLFQMPFNGEYDVITSLNALFAFNDCDKVVEQLVKSLKVGGLLIVDLVNKNHIEYTNPMFGKYGYSQGFTREEAGKMFQDMGAELIEVFPYDYYDNRIFNARREKNKWFSYYFKMLNKLYFQFNLYNYFNKKATGLADKEYSKYLFVAKKVK